MTWHWFPFLVGAPIWASIGIALFSALLATNHKHEAGRTMSRPQGDAGGDENVISLGVYKRRRARPGLRSRTSGADTR